MSWLQLIVLCTWLSLAIIFAARSSDAMAVAALNIVAAKIEEQEERIDELEQELERLKD